MNETWKPVLGYEGYYDVSDIGRVRSLMCKNGKRKKPRIKKHRIRWDGYCVIVLYKNTSKRMKFVHKLVLEAFKGARPDGMETRHMNNIRADNRPENLEWGTRKQNRQDCRKFGTFYRGCKLTPEAVLEVFNLLKNTNTKTRAIAEIYDVSMQTIRNIKNGKRYAWVTGIEALNHCKKEEPIDHKYGGFYMCPVCGVAVSKGQECSKNHCKGE